MSPWARRPGWANRFSWCPVENHIEQQINAIDATRIGLGVADTSFNLDRLAELPERLDNAKYRAWLNRADSLLLQALERGRARDRGRRAFRFGSRRIGSGLIFKVTHFLLAITAVFPYWIGYC